MEESGHVTVDPLYQLKATCPACEQTFQTSRIRPSFKKVVRTDSDFCIHYADPDLNPDYYVVEVCEHCGCSTTKHAMKNWDERRRTLFEENIASQWQPRSYGGKRSWKEALESYQLALITAQTIGESKRVIAGLLHHIAWLYRYQGNHEHEERYLRNALNAYHEVYERESDELNDAKLIFITGELHRRLREYSEAALCFSRIIHDKKIMDAAIIRNARDQWVVMREEMKALKLETPDHLFNEKTVKLTYKKS